MPVAPNTFAFTGALRRLVACLGLLASTAGTVQAAASSSVTVPGSRCEAIFGSAVQVELALLKSLTASGAVTSEIAQNIIAGRDARSLIQQLSLEGKISDEIYDALEDAFVEIRVAGSLGEPSRIATLKSRDGVSRRAEVDIQTHKSLVGDAALVIRDIETKQVLGSIDYHRDGTKLTILIMRVAKQERDQRYSELLIREMLKLQPGAMIIRGQLGMTNLAVLQLGLADGLSLASAATNVPLYKTLAKLGFKPVVKFVPGLQHPRDGSYSIDAIRNSWSQFKMKLSNDGYTEPELEKLDALVAKKIITTEIAKKIVDSTSGKRILWDLMASGKISESEFEYFSDTFAVLPMGHAVGAAVEVPVTPVEGIAPLRPVVLLQEFISHVGENAYALLDAETRRPIATLTFEIKGAREDQFWIDLILVSKRDRRNDYSELLLREVLKKYPEVKSVAARLTDTNEKVLLESLNGGASLNVAGQQTPLYRVVHKLGFRYLKVEYVAKLNSYLIEVKKRAR